MSDAPRIDGFSDLSVIGRGGFSTVYAATQDAFSRRVALKVLNSAADGDSIRRFTRECSAAGALSWHPNIVVVFDAGVTDEGAPFIAMEHLTGGSLADAIAGGPIPWRDATRATIQIADALEAAHVTGLLHRDVKPENVLIDRFGDHKLGDFGIAAVHGSTDTATGVITASISHASPEVLGGERASTSADIYSLGSTLYALLAGRPAFTDQQQTMAETIGRVLHDGVPDLRLRGVPDPIAAVVERAMAKGAADRFASAAELGHALQDAERQLGEAVTPMRSSGSQKPAQPTGVVVPPDATSVLPHEATADRAPGSAARRGLWVIGAVGLVAAAGIAVTLLGDGDDDGAAPPTSVIVSSTTEATTTSDASTTAVPTTGTPTTDAPATTAPPTTAAPSADDAFDLARDLAVALASDDWAAAGAIDTAKADWTVDRWEFGYGALVRAELIRLASVDRGDGTFSLDLGLVAYEMEEETQVTQLFCVRWEVDPAAGTVVQTPDATRLSPLAGWAPLASANAAIRSGC